MRRFAITFAVFTLVLAGCMLGPDYQRPSIDAPEAFRFEDKAAKDLANTAWWEQIKDPVLNDLIRTALAENKDVKIAAARLEEYLGKYGVSRSQLFPQVGANANGSRNRATQSAVPAALPPDVDPQYTNIQATLYASWEIDVWGKIRRLNEAARADLLATEEGRRATILTLVASVASAYINLRDLDRQLEIAKATAASRAESVKVFELRFSGGVVSQMELAQNQSEYEAAAATIPQIEAQIAQQENALSVLLGRNPGPIKRGLDLEQLTLAGGAGRVAVGAACAPPGPAPERAEPDCRQCAHRRGACPLLSHHFAHRIVRRGEYPVIEPVQRICACVELRRGRYDADFHRRRDRGRGATGRSAATAGVAAVPESDPERIQGNR